MDSSCLEMDEKEFFETMGQAGVFPVIYPNSPKMALGWQDLNLGEKGMNNLRISSRVLSGLSKAPPSQRAEATLPVVLRGWRGNQPNPEPGGMAARW